MTRTFWLSFCDNERPAGNQFLGVAVVDVTEEDAADMLAELDLRFPKHGPQAEWIAAAGRLAHLYKCNPGGEVLTSEVPTDIPVPRNRLLQKDELEAFAKAARSGQSSLKRRNTTKR